MSGAELARAASMELDRPQSAVEIRAQVNLIQEVMKSVMIEGVHYGTIPGTPKPSLWKAGSEKILSTFRIAVDPAVLDLSTDDEARYRVTARGISQATGAYLGSGIGEASSNEAKYKWRAAVCDEEFEETPEDRRRKLWKKGDRGPYQIKQVRTNHADVANTILKMAKKRAQIDMTLTVTAASDIFTQDIEDLPEDMRPVAGEDPPPTGSDPGPRPDPEMPKRKSETAAPAEPGFLPPEKPAIAGHRVLSVNLKRQGNTNGKDWNIYAIDIEGVGTADTIKDDHVAVASDCMKQGIGVDVTTAKGKYGLEIVSISPAHVD